MRPRGCCRHHCDVAAWQANDSTWAPALHLSTHSSPMSIDSGFANQRVLACWRQPTSRLRDYVAQEQTQRSIVDLPLAATATGILRWDPNVPKSIEPMSRCTKNPYGQDSFEDLRREISEEGREEGRARLGFSLEGEYLRKLVEARSSMTASFG